MNINFVYAKFPWILPKWLLCVCISLLSCKLKTIRVFRFLGNNVLLLSILPLNIHIVIFSLTFSFFILLDVSFIVSFVNKLSFILPLDFFNCYTSFYLMIFMDCNFLCIYLLFRYLINLSPGVFRSKFRF